MALTVIFGEMTRPVTCQSLRQCRGTYFNSVSALLTYSDITVLHLSVVRRIAERGSLLYTAFETARMPVTPLIAEVTNGPVYAHGVHWDGFTLPAFMFLLLEVSSRPYFASNNRCMGAEVTTCTGKTPLDRPGLKSGYGREICLFFTTSRPVLGPTQPPVQWVRVFFSGDKAAGA